MTKNGKVSVTGSWYLLPTVEYFTRNYGPPTSLHILYRLVSGVCKWGRAVVDEEEQYISKAKITVQEKIHKKLGFYVNMPASGSGNLNNGYITQQLFIPSHKILFAKLYRKMQIVRTTVLLRDVSVMLTASLSEHPGVGITYQTNTAFLDEREILDPNQSLATLNMCP